MNQWIVGECLKQESDGVILAWQFYGVFSSPEAAAEACRGENFFVGEIVVDQPGYDFHATFPRRVTDASVATIG